MPIERALVRERRAGDGRGEDIVRFARELYRDVRWAVTPEGMLQEVGASRGDAGAQAEVSGLAAGADADPLDPAVFVAGEIVPAGAYRRLGTGYVVRLRENGPLPATHDGRVAEYVRMVGLWGDMRETALAAPVTYRRAPSTRSRPQAA